VALDLGVGGSQPRDESLQRRWPAALIFESETEELVEHVIGLCTQPAEELLTSALRPEHAGIERERPVPQRDFRQAIKLPGRLDETRLCMAAQANAQRSLALPRDGEQVVVVEPEQWALEDGREREVIRRKQQRFGE